MRRSRVGREVHGRAIEQPGLSVGFDHGLEYGIEHIECDLAGMLADVVAVGAYEGYGGPGLDLEGSPGAELVVVDDRVVNAEPARGGADILGLALGYEFAGVDSYGHQLVGILLFEPADRRQYMHAVDSAIGPEIQEHQLAAQVFQRESLAARVYPVQARRNRRRGDHAHLVAVCHVVLQCQGIGRFWILDWHDL